MPSRFLDVLFQYLGRMTVGVVLLPALVGGMLYATDHSQTLTVRLWVEYPVYLSSASLSKEFAGVSPAAGSSSTTPTVRKPDMSASTPVTRLLILATLSA